MRNIRFKVVPSETLSKENDVRYVVIDAVTSEVLDDARGYGYKSKEKAEMGWHFKRGYDFRGQSYRQLYKSS